MKTKAVMRDEIISLKKVIELTWETEEEEDVQESDTDMLHLAGTYATDNKGRVWKLDKGLSGIFRGFSLKSEDDEDIDDGPLGHGRDRF